MRMKLVISIAACAAMFLVTDAGAGQISPAYSLSDLGNLGATSGGPFFPRYISATNQVVGVAPTSVPGEFSAFSSVGGQPMTDIGGLGMSVAFAVNGSGVIVGQSESAGVTTATRWVAGVPTAVPGLAGPNNAAGGINESGQIAGWMDAPGGAVAYRLTGDTLENFGNLGGRVSDINGMNAAGRFVGNSETVPGGFTSFRAFISDTASNNLIDLGLLDPAHTASLAFGINDLGTVIGTSNFIQFAPSFVFQAYGFVWKDGVMSGIPAPAGYEIVSPSGINNSEVIVGRVAVNAFATTSEGWIYDGQDLVLLDGLLTPAFADWKITNAWEINNAGFIAAEAIDPNGIARVVLMNPVPLPVPLPLLAGALGLLALRRRRG
jgi:probable HAF family extracellular repeat protein